MSRHGASKASEMVNEYKEEIGKTGPICGKYFKNIFIFQRENYVEMFFSLSLDVY